jgi:hypothetical protein
MNAPTSKSDFVNRQTEPPPPQPRRHHQYHHQNEQCEYPHQHQHQQQQQEQQKQPLEYDVFYDVIEQWFRDSIRVGNEFLFDTVLFDQEIHRLSEHYGYPESVRNNYIIG